jgi:hypothetical protein
MTTTTTEQNQADFDFVMKSMIEQGRPSLRTGPHGTIKCAYRGTNDTKCAAGFFIPDELYSENIEGKGLVAESVRRLGCFKGKSISLLTDMQIAHDRASEDEEHFMDQFRNHMRSVANTFGLDDSSTYLPAKPVYAEN